MIADGNAPNDVSRIREAGDHRPVEGSHLPVNRTLEKLGGSQCSTAPILCKWKKSRAGADLDPSIRNPAIPEVTSHWTDGAAPIVHQTKAHR